MSRDDFVHPVTSQWQRVLNIRGAPARGDQHDLPVPVPVLGSCGGMTAR